jgi:hypothetical protein
LANWDQLLFNIEQISEKKRFGRYTSNHWLKLASAAGSGNRRVIKHQL